MSGVVGVLHERFVLGRRTRVLAARLGRVLPPGTVLDVGCGDGMIDWLIQRARPDLSIRGVDVMSRPVTRIPVELFDGETLPFPDRSFDTVMFVDVLHHTSDPAVLLREAARVAAVSVVVKDHTMDGFLAYSRLRLMDWVGNARHGVALPYNYWPERRWRDAFDRLGLRVQGFDAEVDLYPYPMSRLFADGLHFIATLAVGEHPRPPNRGIAA